MKTVKNPILKGFNPDPSIIRVDDDYYIATSTFEWFPGVQIHHSKDLCNWRLVNRPLKRVSQLDLSGVDDSLGIWAPCLSYQNGIYYLVYTVVKSFRGRYMDSNNYLVTSMDICGDWSEPVYLNSIGFDPSLFHDTDGKKYFVGLTCDNAPEHGWFGGIVLQRYSEKEMKLIGDMKTIFTGTVLGYTEGPHLYRKDGWYYLITAEGGTGYKHAVTVARSKKIEGPYEVDPKNPVLTSVSDPKNPIQKAGHADIVEAKDGSWYMVHLCGRPVNDTKKCILGRETSIQRIYWTEEGWIRLLNGSNSPEAETMITGCSKETAEKLKSIMYKFSDGHLHIDFQSLRIPLDEDILSFSERPGYLRIKGKESLSSTFEQALVARRQQSFCYSAKTCLEFEPETYRQLAGLVCYYNTRNYHYLYISSNDKGKCIGIISCNDGNIEHDAIGQIQIKGWKRCYLSADVRYDSLFFSFSRDGITWEKIPNELDMTILSDENIQSGSYFTGAFIGICCQDLLGHSKHADFEYFEYEEKE